MRIDLLWLAAWFALASLWCITSAWQLGATFDEPVYIRFGLEHWRTSQCRGLAHMGTMPLPADVATLPLYLTECWRGTPFQSIGDLDELLPWARAGNLFFLGLLLVYGWRAGRSLAGPWGGRLAVAFLACEPTVLAHSGLATTDIAISACLLALVYHYRTAREPGCTAGRFRRFAVPIFWFAATVLSKASGLVFAPLCLAVVEIERLARAGFFQEAAQSGMFFRSLFHAWRRSTMELSIILGGGLVLVCLYCGTSEGSARARLVDRVESMPDGPIRTLLLPVARNMPLFNNAANGFWYQVRHNVDGHQGTFLLGRRHQEAVWYYFPAALAIKLTVPLLAMAMALAVLRPASLATWPCLAAAALLVFSFTCRVQIGVRYMLPLVALAIVGMSAACVTVGRQWSLIRFAAPVAVLWSLGSAAMVWPNGLCYTNEFWGGTEHGYLCLSDSNYDWGQGIKELYRWQKAHDIDRLDIWYFGSDPALRHLPMRWLHLDTLPVHEPGGMLYLLRGRYLAVSTTVLYGHPCSESPAAVFLRSCPPVDRTSTFLIYRF